METRAWSLTTPSSAARAAALLDAVPEPDRRTWLVPGPLAPVCRVRRDGAARTLRLSPGDPRRGPGSADRCHLTLHDGVVRCEQRPGRVGGAVLATTFVAAWLAAAVAAAYALVGGSPWLLVGVPAVLLLRTAAEAGRRLDERRYRLWLTTRLGGATAAPATASRAVTAPVWSVADGDCGP